MCIDFSSSTYRWNCMHSLECVYPTFYRKTYTNLLIFVLFVCSFFILFNLSSFIRFSRIKFLSSLLQWVVGTSGLEPPTSRLSGARSNHLSYAPLWLSSRFPHVPLVEMMGIEPMTPCLQGRCSPSWATPPSVWVSFSFLKWHRSLKIEQQWDLSFPFSVQHLFTRRLLLSFGFFFAYLQIRDICERYLTFSIERRWSSRTFRYGYLVTT